MAKKLEISNHRFGRNCPNCGEEQKSWDVDQDAEGYPVYYYDCKCGCVWAFPPEFGKPRMR